MTSKSTNTKLCLVLISIVFAIAFPLNTHAKANLYLEKSADPDALSRDFSIKVLIDSDKPLNAYKINLRYPENILKLKSLDTNNSIISILRNSLPRQEVGSVKIEGGSATPFVGKAGELVTINFSALSGGEGIIRFEDSEAYEADGRGTKTELNAANVPISIVTVVLDSPSSQGSAGDFLQAEIKRESDREAPHFSDISLIVNPVDKSELLLIFRVEDSNSGISSINARYLSWFKWSNWQDAVSPYPIRSSSIWAVQLRSFDPSGNLVSKTIYIWARLLLPVIAIILLIIFTITFRILRRKRFGSSPKQPVSGIM